MLGPIDGMSALDLFAGTGAMGLEALSRGAVHATFVEIDRQAADVIRRNIDATVTDSTTTADLVKGDAPRVLQTLAMAGERFDLVFFDPPYEHTKDMLAATRDHVAGVLAHSATIVLELSAKHAGLVDSAAAAWGGSARTTRTYGDTTVAIIEVERENDAPETFGQAMAEVEDVASAE